MDAPMRDPGANQDVLEKNKELNMKLAEGFLDMN